jgi:hypothetical protein
MDTLSAVSIEQSLEAQLVQRKCVENKESCFSVGNWFKSQTKITLPACICIHHVKCKEQESERPPFGGRKS